MANLSQINNWQKKNSMKMLGFFFSLNIIVLGWEKQKQTIFTSQIYLEIIFWN